MSDQFTDENQAAWDRAARGYAPEVDRDIELLRGGGTNWASRDLALLGDVSGVGRAVYLQCSYGTTALSLLNLGVQEVVGVDISAAMLEQARQKSDALGAKASWIQADVLDLPASLHGTADLVCTGGGALPWVQDIDRWARSIVSVLRPNGRLHIIEGHPLNWVWEPGASNWEPGAWSHRLATDGSGYFDTGPRANREYPYTGIRQQSLPEEAVPTAWERQWTLGRVVTALAQAGLRIEAVEEYAEHFWAQYPLFPAEELARLPHAFGVAARLGS